MVSLKQIWTLSRSSTTVDGGENEGQYFLTKETEFESEHDMIPALSRTSRQRSIPAYVFITVVTALVGIIIILLLIVLPRYSTDHRCAIQLSSYSPAMEAVEYETFNFANDFYQPSIYRGSPSLELEQAWTDLWSYKPINVPLDELESLNKSITEKDWVRTTVQNGGGVAAYIEVFHQLHCLNLVRQFTWRDKYVDDLEAFAHFNQGAKEEAIRTHVDHCIETLRIALICTGDVTPVLIYNEPKAVLGEQVDFSSHHKCRDFKKLGMWTKQHGAAPDGDTHHRSKARMGPL